MYTYAPEKFEITSYGNSSTFSTPFSFNVTYKPYFRENYWIKYNDETGVYIEKYFFDNTEASTQFFNITTNLAKNLTKVSEDYSFKEYNGYYFSDGQNHLLFLLKNNIMLEVNGKDKNAVEDVLKWFVEKSI
jgi:hypothetical protein